MLYAIGPLTFEVAPFNTHEVSRDTRTSHVNKPVIGSRPPLEFTGDGPEEITFQATLFPHKFGGLSSLDTLDSMRASGMPHALVRGDGACFGWYCVTHVREKSTYLDAGGVGKVIEVEITLSLDEAPDGGGYFSALISLLG